MQKNISLFAFEPIFHYRIWGGEKLKNVLKKKYSENKIGESWEISAVKNNETKVKEGIFKEKTLPELIAEFKADLVGEQCYATFQNDFPILIKFIDAAVPLSVQVHPDDFLAKKRHNSFGKNEMWYVLDTDKNADLLIGFNEKLNKNTFKKHLQEESILSVLNSFYVKKGEVYFLPAGRVHAIGKGVLLAEIQQTSDVTYRIYDYERVDKKTGKKRDLHIKESLEAMDFKPVKNYQTLYEKRPNKENLILKTPYFKTDFLSITKKLKMQYPKNESFKIFICTKGKGILKTPFQSMPIEYGKTLFLAANQTELFLEPEPEMELLQVQY